MYCLGFCFSIFFISLNFLTTPQCLVLLCSSSVIFAYVSTLTNEYLLITDNTPKKWRNWYFCVQPVFFHINIFLVFVCPESVIFFSLSIFCSFDETYFLFGSSVELVDGIIIYYCVYYTYWNEFLKLSVNYWAYYAIPMYFRKFSKFKHKCRVFIRKIYLNHIWWLKLVNTSILFVSFP